MQLIDADQLLSFIKLDERVIAPEEHTAQDIVMMIQTAPTIVQTNANVPLTLEELRQMDGEPVWLHTFSAVQKKTQIFQWAILECCSDASAVFLRAGINSRLTKWFCNYGARWLAYRRKPEDGAV